jgi:Ca-activated chloride channel homolog
MNGLTFGSPIVLLVAALFSAAAWWAINREQRRRRRLLGSYGDESLLSPSSTVPSTREHLAALSLKTTAIALGLVALARPQLGDRPASLAHSGADVLVLLDLSRSMNAVDDSIPRLAQAKHGIGQVLAATPENRVGLIVFGGSAFLQLPLTTNQAAFRRFLDAASTDDLGDPATSLASALTAAATTFEHDGERGYQSVLIVSDGESGRDDVGPPLTRLQRAGIPVFAIGVGSPQGAPVPADSTEAPEKWHRDHIGRIVVSHLEEADLKRATRETDGVYARWTPAGLASVARALSRQDKRIISSRESRERVDRFQWPLALSMVALGLVPLVGPSTRKRRK